MRRLTTHTSCPACQTRMTPRVLACPACQLRIESEFRENEFAGLEDEWLHFLRIFIHCEGRITDMEAALGISYPTVKARIAELKRRLGVDTQPDPVGANELDPVEDALTRLEAGEIDYEAAIRQIRSGNQDGSNSQF